MLFLSVTLRRKCMSRRPDFVHFAEFRHYLCS